MYNILNQKSTLKCDVKKPFTHYSRHAYTYHKIKYYLTFSHRFIRYIYYCTVNGEQAQYRFDRLY